MSRTSGTGFHMVMMDHVEGSKVPFMMKTKHEVQGTIPLQYSMFHGRSKNHLLNR